VIAMKRLRCFVLVLGVLMVGCTALPMNQEEAFPLRNMNPLYGFIEVRGTAYLNLYLYDQHKNLITQAGLRGANRILKINGQYKIHDRNNKQGNEPIARENYSSKNFR